MSQPQIEPPKGGVSGRARSLLTQHSMRPLWLQPRFLTVGGCSKTDDDEGKRDNQDYDRPSSAVAKSNDTDFLRELTLDPAQRLMDIEVAAACGAGHGERSPDRESQGNGYRPR